MKSIVTAEQEFGAANDDFEEDFALMTGDYRKPIKQVNHDDDSDNNNTEDSLTGNSESEAEPDNDGAGKDDFDLESDGEAVEETSGKRKTKPKEPTNKKKMKVVEEFASDSGDDSLSSAGDIEEDFSGDDNDAENIEDGEDTENKEGDNGGTWEDIYGRIRDKDGSIVVVSTLEISIDYSDAMEYLILRTMKPNIFHQQFELNWKPGHQKIIRGKRSS